MAIPGEVGPVFQRPVVAVAAMAVDVHSGSYASTRAVRQKLAWTVVPLPPCNAAVSVQRVTGIDAIRVRIISLARR